MMGEIWNIERGEECISACADRCWIASVCVDWSDWLRSPTHELMTAAGAAVNLLTTLGCGYIVGH